MTTTNTSLAGGGPCAATTFSLPSSILGIELLSLSASPVTGYDYDVPHGWLYAQPSISVQGASFCNVTISYTHPGQDDAVVVEAWLPPADEWNGRLQAQGGGGWVAGRFDLTYGGMAAAVANGYVAATTDAGIGLSYVPDSWALVSPGNVNLYKLQNFGTASLGEEADIVKSLIGSYYGKPPAYSYWNGCSQGGRQGVMLASRYADAYDGILVAAPGLNWGGMNAAVSWPSVYMHLTGQHPLACEVNQLTALAISTCDALDGVDDGIISDPEACRDAFDPYAHVGTAFSCSDKGGAKMTISSAAAAVAEAAWTGPVSESGRKLWGGGYEMGADLSTLVPTTTCAANGTCTTTPNVDPYLLLITRDFVVKDLDWDMSDFNLTHKAFDDVQRAWRQQFDRFLSVNDPDLSPFRDAGGKMITYHGLADPTIPPSHTLEYYQQVSALVPDVDSFWRYFRVPGLAHCWGGPGGQPTALFEQLRAWVENGTAPESSPVTITTPQNTTQEQLLCPYPKKAVRSVAGEDDGTGNGAVYSWACVG